VTGVRQTRLGSPIPYVPLPSNSSEPIEVSRMVSLRRSVHQGDCVDIIPSLKPDSIDGLSTDPPYHLTTMSNPSGSPKTRQEGPHNRLTRGFMNQKWDGGDIAFRRDVWLECLRVLKPGAHMAVFGGTRTWHRLAVAIEEAGFEIRDTIMWIYGSGFPKSKDICRCIEKHLGHPNRGCAFPTVSTHRLNEHGVGSHGIPVPPYVANSPEAAVWQGWGSTLKPAYEPILLCRKPLIGTLAENVLMHGVGGINVDACRVSAQGVNALSANWDRAMTTDIKGSNYGKENPRIYHAPRRWVGGPPIYCTMGRIK
jgi:hypothetical protein